MALKFGVTLRNDQLNRVETIVATAPLLRILTGPVPADAGATQTGTLLCEMALPTDWMASASSGVKNFLGPWTGTATGTGLAAYFRILNTAGTISHIQGTVDTIGNSPDMSIDNPNIASGQTVTVTQFTLTAGNA